MAALRCNAAARIGFRLAALHSVAERVNSRKARPPTPHGPRVLTSVGCPHLPLAGRRAQDSRPQLEPEHRVLRSFPRLGGQTAMARQWRAELRIVAAEACGAVSGQTGDRPRRVVRLPTADSLCDRMERGEEKSTARRRVAFQRSHFRRCQARRILTSGRRQFPSGNCRRARDLEGAKRVSRGQA